MTAEARAKDFVNKYPAMFTSDKWFWEMEIATMIIEAEIQAIREQHQSTMKIISNRLPATNQ